jgi:hypothetical protein
MVHVRLVARVRWVNAFAFNAFFFKLWINRGIGWELTGTTSMGDVVITPVVTYDQYVSMSATVPMVTISNAPQRPGQYLFVGWSLESVLYGDINHQISMSWYQISYDIVQIA